jgi:PAS domain S-box-containing protein
MLGYASKADLNGVAPWEAAVHPEDRERASSSVREYLEGKRDKLEMEIRLRHREGHDVHVLSRATKEVDAVTGEPVRVVGTHVDLS